MIEYGLTVSLESSPRTPTTPNTPSTPKPEMNIDSPSFHGRCNAPIRKKLSFSDLMEEDNENNESESISPRVLFMDAENDVVDRHVARRLDFSSLSLNDSDNFHLSPVERVVGSISMLSCGGGVVVSRNGKEVCETNCDCSSCSVGECGVCYANLPLRANHVFTLCGHLFCTRCLLKWWDTSTTCPICRAELYDADDAVDNEASGASAGGGGDVDNEAENNWMQHSEDDEEYEYNEDVEDNEDARDVAADNQAADEYINDIIHTHVNQAIWNDVNDDTSSDDNDSHDENNGRRNRVDIRNVLLIDRYKYLDCEWRWSTSISDPNLDDTVYPLLQEEIQNLRENRDIVMTLFGRMRFRDTLFHSEHFLGDVWRGLWTPKCDWPNIENLHLISNQNRSRIYEFVIRRGCATSPVFEVSMFGFINNVSIKRIDDYDPSVHLDHDWENHSEYVFVADVFTPTDFFVYEGGYQSYGGYDMTEGTITTQQISIPFSHVRRLYRITPNDRWYV
jgi:hypothetical protein